MLWFRNHKHGEGLKDSLGLRFRVECMFRIGNTWIDARSSLQTIIKMVLSIVGQGFFLFVYLDIRFQKLCQDKRSQPVVTAH